MGNIFPELLTFVTLFLKAKLLDVSKCHLSQFPDELLSLISNVYGSQHNVSDTNEQGYTNCALIYSL